MGHGLLGMVGGPVSGIPARKRWAPSLFNSTADSHRKFSCSALTELSFLRRCQEHLLKHLSKKLNITNLLYRKKMCLNKMDLVSNPDKTAPTVLAAVFKCSLKHLLFLSSPSSTHFITLTLLLLAFSKTQKKWLP